MHQYQLSCSQFILTSYCIFWKLIQCLLLNNYCFPKIQMDYRKRQEYEMKIKENQRNSRKQYLKTSNFSLYINNIQRTNNCKPMHSKQNIQAQDSRQKIVLKDLMKENSELRKKIYQLEHDLSLSIIAAEEKEFEYKNVLAEYKNIIEEMLFDVGYSSIDELCPQNNSFENKAKSREFSRGNPEINQNPICGEKHQMKRNSQVSSKFGHKNRNRSAIQSIKMNKLVNVSILEGSSIKSEICHIPERLKGMQSERQIQMQSQNLNYLQGSNSKTMTSITDPISPNFDVYESILEIEQNPTINLKQDQGSSIKQASTKRKGQVTENKREKKGSGKSYSQTESLKMIIEQRNKNRLRIEQLLKNFESPNDYN